MKSIYKTNTNPFVNINKILHPLYPKNGTKRSPWVVLYTRIAQLITHTTNVYIAAACLAIML